MTDCEAFLCSVTQRSSGSDVWLHQPKFKTLLERSFLPLYSLMWMKVMGQSQPQVPDMLRGWHEHTACYKWKEQSLWKMKVWESSNIFLPFGGHFGKGRCLGRMSPVKLLPQERSLRCISELRRVVQASSVLLLNTAFQIVQIPCDWGLTGKCLPDGRVHRKGTAPSQWPQPRCPVWALVEGAGGRQQDSQPLGMRSRPLWESPVRHTALRYFHCDS